MSSILTNSSAMVALQTLKGINNNLSKTQAEISTGKAIGSAKDNAATWAISKVMESDVEGFKGISAALSLGQTTVAVARQASESVTELLTQIKGKIVSSQGDNVDRNKIQTDISALRDQITSVVGAAQFNGLNLVDGRTGSSDVLSSLDRSGTAVASSNITITGVNLTVGNTNGTPAVKTGFLDASDGITAASDSTAFQLPNDGTTTGTLALNATANFFAMGDKISLQIGGKTASYTFTEADIASTSQADVAAMGLKKAVEALGVEGLSVDYDNGNSGELVFTNDGDSTLTVNAQITSAGTGGLGALNTMDVSTAAGAQSALANIESLIQTSIDASAAFGSTQSRIETQAKFVSNLTDAMRTGIGALVDADMEEVSARLQALQVQQQLGVQSLSIANQAPQSVLSLFR